ncbi:hypothetical protein [Brevundimonas sp.]|uniref:hypothetical protein n=1 Tax=Brevundimonas sp. TaxID=1871086 RepID=UPI003D6D9AB9
MMMLAMASQTTAQVPVDAPHLPTGPLAYAGAFGTTRLYVDTASWERSDLPNLVRGTAVITTSQGPAPVQTVLMWIDCGRRVYQLSSGRAYDEAGLEIASTTYLPDQAIGDDGPVKQLADSVCVTPFAFGTEAVDNWRAALQDTRAAAQGEAR